MSNKPREFWIEYYPEKSITGLIDIKPIEPAWGYWKNVYRVIDRDEYDKLQSQADELASALERFNYKADIQEPYTNLIIATNDIIHVQQVLAKYREFKGETY